MKCVWISVDDELPIDDKEEVLVSLLIDFNGKMKRRYALAIYGTAWGVSGFHSYTVTHWMHLPEHPGFKNARGILPWKEGDELPEDIIRRLRDKE